MKIPPAITFAAAVLLAAPLLRAAAGTGEDLARAREAAGRGAEPEAFDIAITAFSPAKALHGTKPDQGQRDLFLYAVETLPGNSRERALKLAGAAGAMLDKKSEDSAWYLGACKAARVLDGATGAVSNCRKALELDPIYYPVYRELGLAYAAAGEPRKAEETLAQGVEISSSDYKARYYLAKTLEKYGEPGRAAASYSRALQLARQDSAPDAEYYRKLIRAGLKHTAGKVKKEKVRAKKPAPPRPGNRQLAAACMVKFRAEAAKDNIAAALKETGACLKHAPSDPDLAAERAPLLVRLGRYEEGVAEYERAASLYGEKAAPYVRARIKAAETWIKLGRHDKALAQYDLALKASPHDMNALRALAAEQEARSDPAGALRTYETISALEPSNDAARRRVEELKDASLTDGQILDELKLRLAADPNSTVLQPEDKKLYKAIRAAELGGAVDYLKLKVPSGRGLIVKKKTAERTHLLLSHEGYKAYVFQATREAISFLEGEGVDMREMFKLRTLAGDPVFDPAGRLTPEGLELWRKASPGNKAWLLPYEPVPASPQAQQADREIQEAEKKGYIEISEPEYLWLLRYTDCPEDVMLAEPISAMTVNDGARLRYLICGMEIPLCLNKINESVALAISDYRNNHTEISDSKHSTAFFGTGGIKKHKLCENGKIWGYDGVKIPLPGEPPRK